MTDRLCGGAIRPFAHSSGHVTMKSFQESRNGALPFGFESVPFRKVVIMDVKKATALLTHEEIRIRGLLTDLESGGEVSRTGSVEHLEAPQDRSLDGGSELAERSLQMGMLEQLQGELHDLARARADLAAGDYGKCLTCGAMIADERLNAMPTTQRCIKHA